jgi:DNA-binding protein HU-beta
VKKDKFIDFFENLCKINDIKINGEIHLKIKTNFMNKADLVSEISSKTGLTKTKSGEVVDTIIETLQNTLSNGEKITLVGFGSFGTIERKERKGRNPQNGAEITIPARRSVKFKSGSSLDSLVNS